MNDFKEWLGVIITGLGMDILAIKSGLVGGFMSLTYEKRRTPRQAIVSILSGMILAGYLGPLAASFFDLEGGPYSGACFIIGLLSMRIVPMIFAKAEDLVKSTELINKKKNGKGSGDPSSGSTSGK